MTRARLLPTGASSGWTAVVRTHPCLNRAPGSTRFDHCNAWDDSGDHARKRATRRKLRVAHAQVSAGMGPNPDPGGRSAVDAAGQANPSVPAPVLAPALPPAAGAPAEERARQMEGSGPAPNPAAGPPPPTGRSTEERSGQAAEERCGLYTPLQPCLGAMRAEKSRASEAPA